MRALFFHFVMGACLVTAAQTVGSSCARAWENPGETVKWQAAIDSVAARGGVVSIPAGRHLVGQLDLRSNVELHLEKGAVLEGKVGLENYRVTTLPYSEGTWCAIVSAIGVTNVAITGEGEIFGNGTAWPQPEDYGGNQEGRRPRGVFFANCKDVRLSDFTLRDSACWGVVFKCCENVDVRRLKIDNHANANNDGIDIEAKNVVIADCDIDAGDDGVCLKSNTPDFIVENVLVTNVVARSHCNALKLGTASHGTMRNVLFVDCRTEAPRRDFIDRRFGRNRRWYEESPERIEKAPGARLGEASGTSAICVENVDGGVVENVTYRNVIANGFRSPIFVRAGTRSGRSCGTPPSDKYVFRNICIENVTGTALSGLASSISGVPGCRLVGMTLRNVRIKCRGLGETAAERTRPVPEAAGKYPDAHMFGCMLPAYGLYVRHVDGFRMENVVFELEVGTTDRREAMVLEDICPCQEAKKPLLKVLMIGNSFTASVMRETPTLAALEGLPLDIVQCGIGGCPLDKHWANVEKGSDPAFKPYSVSCSYASDPGRRFPTSMNLTEALVADRWNVVTIQQASGKSAFVETYQPYADNLIAKIRELAPQAEIVIQETWSYTPYDLRLAKWQMTPAQMHAALRKAYLALAGKHGLRLIPMGDAVQLFRERRPVDYGTLLTAAEIKAIERPNTIDFHGDVCGESHWGKGNAKYHHDWQEVRLRKDFFHLNMRGHYLQACVWLAKLFAVDPTTFTYRPAALPEADAKLMRECARDVSR